MSKHVIVLMGINGAGKSTLVQQLVAQGYHRINRDTTGGTLDGQVKIAELQILDGVTKKIVLDNTYPTVESRKTIIKFAKHWQAKISCHWLTTSFEDAQLNACLRMVKKTGKLLSPEEMKASKDPNLFPPVALFNYRKIFEKPTTNEGFDEVIEFPFKRIWPSEYKNKAIILDYDGTLRESLGQYDYPIKLSDIKVNRISTNIIHEFKQRGYLILGASNQSGISKGILSDNDAIDCFKETNRQLNIDVDFMYCPHRIPPVSCYCRKPHPGMGAYFIEKYKLLPSLCVMVGDQTTDETFAERCGFKFIYANDFFK